MLVKVLTGFWPMFLFQARPADYCGEKSFIVGLRPGIWPSGNPTSQGWSPLSRSQGHHWHSGQFPSHIWWGPRKSKFSNLKQHYPKVFCNTKGYCPLLTIFYQHTGNYLCNNILQFNLKDRVKDIIFVINILIVSVQTVLSIWI